MPPLIPNDEGSSDLADYSDDPEEWHPLAGQRRRNEFFLPEFLQGILNEALEGAPLILPGAPWMEDLFDNEEEEMDSGEEDENGEDEEAEDDDEEEEDSEEEFEEMWREIEESLDEHREALAILREMSPENGEER
ncbi:Oidioi.mRNA.OKI2018_I69.XSR.g14429.t1.cds [Oikopleura dioica]|uniref:Oidioi.mRNA.OKI2018_I69.XSR.g14429.t1.cds n=1 Tax=Oikopleura dioica TaxID=34765 RepID=A0ABN7S9R2_OIKDI|nr:Oidioi.mRNA.OKI2018_I69.XSR.g14429.t1.cds [Oikopleura dioica]